jgi:hypothetical protein
MASDAGIARQRVIVTRSACLEACVTWRRSGQQRHTARPCRQRWSTNTAQVEPVQRRQVQQKVGFGWWTGR